MPTQYAVIFGQKKPVENKDVLTDLVEAAKRGGRDRISRPAREFATLIKQNGGRSRDGVLIGDVDKFNSHKAQRGSKTPHVYFGHTE